MGCIAATDTKKKKINHCLNLLLPTSAVNTTWFKHLKMINR